MDPGLFVFLLALRGRGHRAATLHAQRRSLTNCREAAPVLAGSEPRKFADVAQMEERDHAMVEAAGSNPAFRSTFGCALAPPATRAPGTGEAGMCTGLRPMCSERAWSALPIARAWTQPKVDHALVAQMEEQLPCQQRVARSNRRRGHPSSRVRLAGQGCWAFTPATRVRIPYTTPMETGRKDRAAPELVTGTPCRHPGEGRGRGRWIGHPPRRRTTHGSLTQWPECVPVEDEAAGSTPARTAMRHTP